MTTTPEVPMTQPPTVADEAAVVLFDLDGVLTRRDTMGDLVTRELRRCPLRLLAAVPPVLLARALPPQHRWVPRLNRYLVAIALRGVDPDRYRQLVTDTAHRLASEPGNVPDAAVEAVRAAGREGRVIVVTASEHTLARTFLTAIGLPDVEVIASHLRNEPTRVRFGTHNVGPGKVTHLQRAGVNLATATLYTDSASDLPLARQVRTTVLVNPTPRAHRIMTRALPAATRRTLRWE